MRVVLDANVYVSSLLTQRGNAKQIMDLFEAGEFDLIVSEPILAEVERVLGYSHIAKIHRKGEDEIKAYVEHLQETAELVAPTITLDASPDETDNRYIECAVEGKADYLVTGDKKHLLPLNEYEGVHILSPASFLAILKLEME